MKIVVLVKQVPDTFGERKLDTSTGLLDRDASDRVIDEISERSLEVALSHKDANKGTEIVALSMGPEEAKDALKKALSMGADSAVHVVDDGLAGADLVATARVLAAVIAQQGADLVIAGNESTDGRGGAVAGAVAEVLGRPALTSLDSVEISDSQVSGTRGTEGGTLTVHVGLPAIISITERNPEARFPSFKGIMSAKKKPMTPVTVAELGVDLGVGGRSEVLTTAERPAREAGVKVVDDGNSGAALVEFLAAERLI